MRALLQRVSSASVVVASANIDSIGAGLLILLGVAEDDQQSDLDFLLKKIPSLRIFADPEGKMNLSVQDIIGEILVVSQFTLIADTSKGNRPSFFKAAKPEKASAFYEEFVAKLKCLGLKIATGKFGADMKVCLVNDGPVTILLDSKEGS